ncbi:MAG TPA: GNAT family N-acetyltransferase [Devosia sp.]|jgi:GNAT superfamily N-acetyltransferase|uniref:GNAT family N-acetyltransferase n=1 Tax=Devosia sp. TaxID=1871048 RepID=UPI002F955918
MKPSLMVRTINDDDVEQVVKLWNEAGLLRPWNDPRYDIAFARQNDNSTVLVGTISDLLVAAAIVGHDGHRGWLYYVASSSLKRGRGLGRLIVETAESWLAARCMEGQPARARRQ